MSFATDVLKSASERFFLVKITPKKYLTPFTLVSAGVYSTPLSNSFLLDEVFINGSPVLTFTHSSDLLTITTGTNLTLTTNIVTITHKIYLTGTKTRITDGVSGLDDAEWKPLIQKYPTFSQTMRNIADGVFTLADTEISVISTDRWIQMLLSENDSLYRAKTEVWVCIDSVDVNRKVFDGEIASVSHSYGISKLTILDSFNRLKEEAKFGTWASSHLSATNSGEYPNSADEGIAIPITIGSSSPVAISTGWRHLDPYGTVNGGPMYHISSGQRAFKRSPQIPSATSSVSFMCGRGYGSDVRRLNFGTISNAYELYVSRTVPRATNDPSFGTGDLTIYDKILYLGVSSFNGEIGDYIPTVEGWVCGIGSPIWSIYNIAICCPQFGSSALDSNNASPPVSGVVSPPAIPNNTIPSMSLWIEGGDAVNYQPYYYPLALVPSATGRNHATRYLKFTTTIPAGPTLPSGEPTFSVIATVDPSANGLVSENGSNQLASANVRCRFSPAGGVSHGDAMKAFIENSGMTVNDASFTQADSDLTAFVSMTIPFNEGAFNFPNFLECAQALASSTLSILRVNQDREVEYEVIKDPGSLTVDTTRDRINILVDSMDARIQYQDIATSVQFENPQYYTRPEAMGTGAKAFVENTKAKYLHNVDNTKVVKHYLNDIGNRKDAIAGYFANPTVEYSLATASEDLASSIGDVVEITNDSVAGSDDVARGIIVGLDQSGSSSNVKINEIRGL